MKTAAAVLLWGLLLLPAVLLDASSGHWTLYLLLYFVDLPAVVYVLLPSLAVAALICGWRELVLGMAVALDLAPEASREEVIRGARSLLFLGRMALGTGSIVSLAQAVISAHNSASLLDLLPALGVSALPLLYGLLGRVLCLIALQHAKRRLGDYVFYGE